MKMMALGKFNYGTRRLQAGDQFDADLGNENLLLALRLAAEVSEQNRDDTYFNELDGLRLRYQAIFGRPCDGRWGPSRIKKAIEGKGQ